MTQTGLAWKLLPYGEEPGPVNMAIDHALADCLESDRATIRFYGWTSPTISLGRNQPAAGRYDRLRAEGLGIGFVRRPTGGRAVLHDRELTYSVVFPARSLGSLREAYRSINRALVHGLRLLGVDTELAAPATTAERPGLRACFDGSAPDEVVVDGRKLLGSAQAKIGRAVLQHGSLLLRDDQTLLAALTPDGALEAPPTTLAELLGTPPPPETVAARLTEGFEAAMGERIEAATPAHSTFVARVDQLRAIYEDPAWTWRR